MVGLVSGLMHRLLVSSLAKESFQGWISVHTEMLGSAGQWVMALPWHLLMKKLSLMSSA